MTERSRWYGREAVVTVTHPLTSNPNTTANRIILPILSPRMQTSVYLLCRPFPYSPIYLNSSSVAITRCSIVLNLFSTLKSI